MYRIEDSIVEGNSYRQTYRSGFYSNTVYRTLYGHSVRQAVKAILYAGIEGNALRLSSEGLGCNESGFLCSPGSILFTIYITLHAALA